MILGESKLQACIPLLRTGLSVSDQPQVCVFGVRY